MTDIAFVDTETLGLDPDYHPVWEVALILDDTEYVWQVEVTAREKALAHPIALEVARFAERYNVERDALPREQVARELWDLIPDRCHLVGAVISFDEERLRRMLWHYGLPIPWHYHLVDVEALAAGWLAAGHDWSEGLPVGDKARPPWDSTELSLAVGVDPERFTRHSALGDARWAKAIYEAVMS